MAKVKGRVKIGDILGKLEMDLEGAFSEFAGPNIGGILAEDPLILFSSEREPMRYGRGWGAGFEKGMAWLTGSTRGLGFEKSGTRILFERQKGSSHVRYHADRPPF